MKFSGTLLTTSENPTRDEINKAILDLLDKINKTQTEQALQNSVPPGIIFKYAGLEENIPDGYLLCDGRDIKRAAYRALFDKIGTTWGSGDGVNTFALPNHIGCSGVGAGLSTGFLTNETLAIGSRSDDQIENIRGGFASADRQGGGIFVNPPTPGAFNAYGIQRRPPADPGSGTPAYLTVDFDASRVVRTGTTTHGKIIAFNYIIKT